MRGIPYSGVNNLLWRWNWNHLSESCFTFTVTSKSNCKRLLSSTRYLAMDTSNSRTYFQSHPTTLQVHPGKPGKLYIDLGAAPSQSESQNPGQILNLSVIPAKYPETLSECIAGVQLFGKDESILEDSLHHLVKVAFSDEEKATVMKVTINQMDEMPKEDLHLEISVPHSFGKIYKIFNQTQSAFALSWKIVTANGWCLGCKTCYVALHSSCSCKIFINWWLFQHLKVTQIIPSRATECPICHCNCNSRSVCDWFATVKDYKNPKLKSDVCQSINDIVPDVYCDGRDSECSIKVSQMECKNFHMHLKAGSCELFSVKVNLRSNQSVLYVTESVKHFFLK